MSDNSCKVIRVDCRENAADLLRSLEDKYGFGIKTEQLKLGDYLIPPDTVVERKTVADFAVSILDGRLFDQAFRLAEHTENPIMIVEGESFENLNLSLACIKGALITLAQTFRLPVLRTRNQEDTAWYISQLARQRERIGRNKGVRRGYKPKKIEIQKEHILSSLPGIGAKSAKALLEEFGSVSNVMKASEKEIMKVPGIGKKTAEKIQSVIRDSAEEYGRIGI